jgi:hypothetical protein
MILSKPSLHCRLDWRPSTWLQIIVFILMVLALLSLQISALAWYFSLLLGLVIVYGTALQIGKIRQMPPCSLFWRAGDGAMGLNFGHGSESLTGPRCHQQGPLWIISALDASGQKRHFLFLPDTLSRSERRMLRLVAATPLTLD